jgi:uncharacterized BrkB/YihY/UPF0761 family membrane protein
MTLPAPLPPPDPATRTPSDAPAASSGFKAKKAAAQAKFVEVRRSLEEARPHSKTIDLAFAWWEHDVATGGAVLAAALAFRLFLFLVPYVFALVYGLGLFADAAGRDPERVAQQVGVAGLIATTIKVAGDQSITTRVIVFVTAAVAMIIAGRAVVKVVSVSHALVWRVPPRKYPHLTRAAGGLIGVVTAAGVFIQILTWLRAHSLPAGILGEVLFIGVPGTLWLVFSWRNLPHAPDVTWSDLIPGSVLFGVGVQILHFITVFWITRLLASKSETYGAVGAALAILFWTYLCGRLMTGSAVLNAAWWEGRRAT